MTVFFMISLPSLRKYALVLIRCILSLSCSPNSSCLDEPTWLLSTRRESTRLDSTRLWGCAQLMLMICDDALLLLLVMYRGNCAGGVVLLLLSFAITFLFPPAFGRATINAVLIVVASTPSTCFLTVALVL